VAWIAVVLVAMLAGVGSAAAQDDPYDPYGPTSTDPPTVSSTEAGCSLSVDDGQAGRAVTATVTNVPVGELVRILFGGIEVGRATATGPGDAGLTTVTIPYTVPSMTAGRYLIVAVGSTFTADCAESFGVEVGGVSAERPGGNGGALPRTGIYVGLLLAIAFALLVGGRALVEGSHQRRKALARAERRQAAATRPERRVLQADRGDR
jgi:hypothetical protein